MLSVRFVCVKLLYVKFVCVKVLYVKLLYVKLCVCVKLLYVKFVCVREAAGGGEGARDTESKTRTPQKVVGKNATEETIFCQCQGCVMLMGADWIPEI